MPINISALRELVAMDESDPVARFALGQRLFSESSSRDGVNEAALHLEAAHDLDPNHLATYQVLGQVYIQQNRIEEAREILEEGIRRASREQQGSGHDLVPIMEGLLESL